jgi:hypothetical protein
MHDDPLTDFESALRQLHPARPRTTAAQILTQSAVHQARRRTRQWQAVAALLALTTTLSLLARPAPRIIEKPILIEPQPLTVTTSTPGRLTYLDLRTRILSQGLDALDKSPTHTPNTKTPRATSIEF